MVVCYVMCAQRSLVRAVLMLREMAGDEVAELEGQPLLGAPEFAVELASHRAALHTEELAELARVLDAHDVKLPTDRFDASQAELLRYGATFGLLEVGPLSMRLTSVQHENPRVGWAEHAGPSKLHLAMSPCWRLMKGWRVTQADTPEQRAVAIEAAAQAIMDTLKWRQKRKFMTPQQLNAWEQYVSVSRSSS
jgi:hypothetical protein